MKKMILFAFISPTLLLTACNTDINELPRDNNSHTKGAVVSPEEKPSKDNTEDGEEKDNLDENKSNKSTEKGNKWKWLPSNESNKLSVNSKLDKEAIDALYEDADDMKERMMKLSGTKAKDIELIDSSGEKKNLSDYLGNNVILGFVVSWEKDSYQHIKVLDEYNKRNEESEFIGVVSFDDEDGYRKIVDEFETEDTTFYVSDETAISDYMVDSVPYYVFIDKEGYIQMVSGGLPDVEMLEEFANASF